MFTERELKEIAYELYKKDWVNIHVPYNTQLLSYRQYCIYLHDGEEEFLEYDDYLNEYGFFNFGLYVGYSEFISNEYCDSWYMNYLLEEGSPLWEDYCTYNEVYPTYVCELSNELQGFIRDVLEEDEFDDEVIIDALDSKLCDIKETLENLNYRYDGYMNAWDRLLLRIKE